MKKFITVVVLILTCAMSFSQVTTTKIVKVATATTVFNEPLLNGIEIINLANKKIYLTLQSIPANKSISTCVLNTDIKELTSISYVKNGVKLGGDTVKLGGVLTENTAINQNGRTFKILNAGHGSAFSQTGIAYTKIDTANFVDSTLITKFYTKKYKLKRDSILGSGYATNHRVNDTFVPYNNAKKNVQLGNHSIKSINFISDTTYNATGTEAIGSRFWDSENNTTSLVLPNGVVLQDGEEVFFDVINQTGGALADGKVASYAGAVGASGKMKAQYGIADYTVEEPNHIIGIITEPIANGGFGKVTYFGKVRGIQTNGANYSETWADGDVLYVSASSYGGLTNIMPEAPYPAIPIAVVIKAHATMGTIAVRPTFPVRLQDLADVNGTPLSADGQIPTWHNNTKYFDFDKNINNYKLKSDSINLSGYFTNYKALSKQNNLTITTAGTSGPSTLTGSVLNIPQYTGGGGSVMVYPDAGIAVSTGLAWGTSLTDNSTNWNTAYTDRFKWDGGPTGLNAATGRTSLGLGNSAIRDVGTTTGTVLEGRTFGTAANSAITDFAPASGSANYVQVSPASAQIGNIWMNGNINLGILPTGNVPFATRVGTGNYWQFGQNVGTGSNDDTFGIYSSSYGANIGTYIPIMQLNPNGLVNFSSIINTSGYKLNTIDLFSSLTSNRITQWDGTKFTSITDGTAGQVLKTNGSGVYSFVSLPNTTPQPLTGITPTWNVNNGINANITLSGSTIISLTNLVAGMSGTLIITNPTIAYQIKFSGYTTDIKGVNLTIDSNGILCSGNNKTDTFGWYYDGISLKVHVALNYTRIIW